MKNILTEAADFTTSYSFLVSSLREIEPFSYFRISSYQWSAISDVNSGAHIFAASRVTIGSHHLSQNFLVGVRDSTPRYSAVRIRKLWVILTSVLAAQIHQMKGRLLLTSYVVGGKWMLIVVKVDSICFGLGCHQKNIFLALRMQEISFLMISCIFCE